jgi:hypothetical protein
MTDPKFTPQEGKATSHFELKGMECISFGVTVVES